MIPDTASLWAGVRKFEELLKKDPQAYSFAPLADLYRTLGLLDDALQLARKGCTVHPEFAAGQMALARAALESSFKDEARRALEAVVRITPENLEAERLLADIYAADGDQAASLRCLAIVSSLDASLPEPIMPVPTASAEQAVEELDDEDILELTDDLIETESLDIAVSPFAAAPDRPSLGDAPLRAEPFLMETAPPLYERDEAAAEQMPEEVMPAAAEAEEPAAVVASATIAELYISQGFPDKGVAIYRELLQTEPDNLVWQTRLAELSGAAADEPASSATAATVPPAPVEPVALATTPAAAPTVTGTAPAEGVLETLGGWLANIGRTRQCRTKSI